MYNFDQKNSNGGELKRKSPSDIVTNLKLDCGLCKPKMYLCLSNQRSTASPARDQLVNILGRTGLFISQGF